MQLSPQTLLQGGKYKIIEKIGQGGFGIVYRATHQGLQTEVCIKEFFYSDLCERMDNSSRISIISTSAEKIKLVNSLQKKFTKEAQRIAKFQHPNIVLVMDTFEENNTAYFVMEFLNGGSLDELLKREGVISEQKAKAIILPIIDAMEAVHKMDLLHLDLKPANIMLRKNHSPVLIDFGISKYLETVNGATTNAPIGISKGYAPLEQYGGSISDFSKATDVYSLCATIYYMVTGFTPPEPLQMLTNGFKSPRDLRPQLTPDFNAAILKGLATKAVDRQQSMAQLKAELGELKTIDKGSVLKRDVAEEEVVEDTFTELCGTNNDIGKVIEKLPYAPKSTFPSTKMIVAIALLLLLNVFFVSNTYVKFSNSNFFLNTIHLVSVQINSKIGVFTFIRIRDLASVFMFLCIVFQWFISLMLCFNIKSSWNDIYETTKSKLFRYFAIANVNFTLLLAIAFCVSLSASSVLGNLKIVMGTTSVRLGSTYTGYIGGLSLVCLLISAVAIIMFWSKKYFAKKNISKNKK